MKNLTQRAQRAQRMRDAPAKKQIPNPPKCSGFGMTILGNGTWRKGEWADTMRGTYEPAQTKSASAERPETVGGDSRLQRKEHGGRTAATRDGRPDAEGNTSGG